MNDKISRARMAWNCEKKGCFNKKCRPKIEVFADCFPGKIAMGDVDAITDINGNFILLEWKPQVGHLKDGQRILYERLSGVGFYVLVVAGDAESMAVIAYCEFWKGKQWPWRHGNLEDVRNRIKNWVAFAQKQRRK